MGTKKAKPKSLLIAAGVLAAVLALFFLYFSPVKVSYQTTGVLLHENAVEGYGDEVTPGIDITVDGVLKWVYYEDQFSWKLEFEGTFIVGEMDFSDYTTTLSTLYFDPRRTGHFLSEYPYDADIIFATQRFQKGFIEFKRREIPDEQNKFPYIVVDHPQIVWPAQTREEALQVIEEWGRQSSMWRP
ncbi:MAG: hypothetical protein GX580_11455 [Candidatus Hydrogenedens sp.]|nr:hypothetical protein [Candidatus Hydrogenedens sp.]